MQLVYFNDLHKNLGCNKGRTGKISIIPVTFTVPPVIFCALPSPVALFFSHSLSPPSSNCPVRTDISIVQKTCEFRPVDISVPLAKCNKLIYQSVYSLLETLAGNPFRKSRKKAAAPGAVQRLVYNIKVSQFFLAA